jgi:hypothetical protein
MSDPQLSRILTGVKDAPNRFERLFDNIVEELPPDDFLAAYDLADLLLTNRDEVLWALTTKH